MFVEYISFSSYVKYIWKECYKNFFGNCSLFTAIGFIKLHALGCIFAEKEVALAVFFQDYLAKTVLTGEKQIVALRLRQLHSCNPFAQIFSF